MLTSLIVVAGTFAAGTLTGIRLMWLRGWRWRRP